jgi:hypothetical protein
MTKIMRPLLQPSITALSHTLVLDIALLPFGGA